MIAIVPLLYTDGRFNGAVGDATMDRTKTMVEYENAFSDNFLLLWGWNIPSERLVNSRGNAFAIWAKYRWLENLETGLEGQLEKLFAVWRNAVIFGDLGQFEKAEQLLRDPLERYQ